VPVVPPAIERLHTITAPTLAMTGELDLPDFQAIADLIATTVPNGRRVTIPGVGHLPNLENPEAFNDVLSTFLDDVEAREEAAYRRESDGRRRIALTEAEYGAGACCCRDVLRWPRAAALDLFRRLLGTRSRRLPPSLRSAARVNRRLRNDVCWRAID